MSSKKSIKTQKVKSNFSGRKGSSKVSSSSSKGTGSQGAGSSSSAVPASSSKASKKSIKSRRARSSGRAIIKSAKSPPPSRLSDSDSSISQSNSSVESFGSQEDSPPSKYESQNIPPSQWAVIVYKEAPPSPEAHSEELDEIQRQIDCHKTAFTIFFSLGIASSALALLSGMDFTEYGEEYATDNIIIYLHLSIVFLIGFREESTILVSLYVLVSLTGSILFFLRLFTKKTEIRIHRVFSLIVEAILIYMAYQYYQLLNRRMELQEQSNNGRPTRPMTHGP